LPALSFAPRAGGILLWSDTTRECNRYIYRKAQNGQSHLCRYTMFIVRLCAQFFMKYLLCIYRTYLREHFTGSCANPAEPIKESCAGNQESPVCDHQRINSQNTADFKKQEFAAPKTGVNTTTKDILALLQIFLHIPFKRSMGLVESLFGKCRNGSPA